MKNQTYLFGKTGQYASSETFHKGSKREALTYLRNEALELRKASRDAYGLDTGVHAILSNNKHKSELVNLASFEIKRIGSEGLIRLLNTHGVMTYSNTLLN